MLIEKKTHTIEIANLPHTLLLRIDARVKAQGGDRDSQIRELIEKGLAAEQTRSAESGFDEALRTIRKGFEESGADEEETLALMTEELRAVRSKRKLATVHHGG